MKSRLVLLLLAAHAGTALAQYKCTAANGAITFQQTPCFGAKSEQKLDVVPNGHPRPAPPASGAAATPPPATLATPASASDAGGSVNKRMLANYELQNKREALARAVQSAKDDKARRADQQARDVDAARRQFGDDPANASSLREALAAIDSRYKALGELDDVKIKSAQSALDTWDQDPANATKK